MKTFKLITLLIILSLALVINVNAAGKGEKTVVYKATLHCESCKAKVEKNIPFEKGVKGLKVDLKEQTITVTFREDKNSIENIQKAIEKLDIPIAGFLEKKSDEPVKKASRQKGEKVSEGCKEKCEKEAK